MAETVIILVMLGAAFGSFLNVCAYRIPRGMSVVLRRSFCPQCNRGLAWYEVVPLLGFLILGGKCRACGSSIASQYPLVEVISAGFALLLFDIHGLSFQLVWSFVIVSLMMLIAIIDWQHLRIPNVVVVSSLVLGILMRVVFKPDHLISSVSTSSCAFGTMLVIRLVGNFLFKKETIGMGDVKFAAVVGFFIGFGGFLLALWVAAVAGSVIGISRSLRREQRLRAQRRIRCFGEWTGNRDDAGIPLGACLAAASCIVLTLQERIHILVETWSIWIR